MTPPDDEDRPGEQAPETAPERLEHEIDELRDDLEKKVTELAKRGREATDLTVQARRHPWAVVAAGVVLVAGAAGFVLWRKRRAAGRSRHATAKGR